METISELNEYQKNAVMDESKACLVNACVGSGKTTVLVNKVIYLHTEKKIPLSDIVVLTFTNKAAGEIISRLKAADSNISEDDTKYFGTFHSVALKMLKTVLPVKDIGYDEDFAVMDVDEENELAQSLVASHNLNIKYLNSLYKRIEAAKKENFLYGRMKKEDDIRSLLEILKEEKRKQNKMDFDDLISYAVQLIPEVGYRPAWIITDEFQDTNSEQLMFIDSLAGKDTKLFAVGDPNQIIYTWRGSCKDIFDRFRKKYGATEMSLPENYRSSSNIIEAARCFLDEPSELSTSRAPGNKIIIKNHYNSFAEAQYLADKISELSRQGIPLSEIAVFYRTQRQSGVIEDVFSKAGISYEVSLKKTLKDVPVLNWFIHLLKFSVNPLDTDSALMIISDSKFGTQPDIKKAKAVINNIRKEYGTELTFDMTDSNNSDSELLEKSLSFREWCTGHSRLAEVYDFYELDKYLHPTSVSYGENRGLVQNLLKKIDDHILSGKIDLFRGTQDFINSSALYGAEILEESATVKDSVKLMTLHAAKGLEFRYVFIIGVNNGLIPLRINSYDEEKEERRLFFVGITRAKENLELSYYTSPDDGRAYGGPGRFISFIPVHLREYEGDRNVTKVSDLQQLRKQLTENIDSSGNVIMNLFGDKTSEEEKSADNNISEAEESKNIRKFSHEQYGIGILVEEDDMMITLNFEGYGDKQFIKAFSEVIEID